VFFTITSKQSQFCMNVKIEWRTVIIPERLLFVWWGISCLAVSETCCSHELTLQARNSPQNRQYTGASGGKIVHMFKDAANTLSEISLHLYLRADWQKAWSKDLITYNDHFLLCSAQKHLQDNYLWLLLWSNLGHRWQSKKNCSVLSHTWKM